MRTGNGMEKREHDQDMEIDRKSSLIAGRTKAMALTYIGSTFCAAAVVIIDSLVAGVSIGPEALAAIAAAGPLLTIGEILHCLLGYGIDKLMIQAIGRGKRKEADRIFGAILIAVAVVYLLVYIILLAIERPLLELIMTDPTLIDRVIHYTVPLFITAPLFEVLLCIERAFRIDGRAKLFSKRNIVTNIANIIFDILLVSVFNLDVAGLAWASVISTILGYTITISHFFSKKRTVSPDFTVLFSSQELLSYVKKDIRLGSSATLDEVASSLALAAQTAIIGTIGGTGGLAIWAVYKSLRGVSLSVGNGVSASVSVHSGLLYGQKDYSGVRYAVKEGTRLTLLISLGVIVLVLLLATPISILYNIDPDLRALCSQCLRIGCIVFPALSFLTVITSYLPAVNRIAMTNRIVLVQYGLTIIAAGIGSTLGLQGFFVLYVLAGWAAVLVFRIFLKRDRFWFVPEHDPETIVSYSIQLQPDLISAIGADVRKHLDDSRCHANPRSRIALVVEDGLSYIAQHNAGEQVHADVEIKQNENGLLVMITDDGSPYNPLVDCAQETWNEPGALEAAVVLGFASEVGYDRMLELNQLSVTMDVSATE